MSSATRTASSAFVVGEALIDVVVDGSSTVEHPGGSPMNVAFGLARLGVPTTFRATIGRDARGHALLEHLSSAGVALDADTLTDRPTSTAIATLQADRHAEYEFEIEWDPGAIEVPGGTDLVHTGSIASVLRPGAGAVLDVFAGLRASTLLSFDPNVRPSITPDHATVGVDVDRLASLAHIVKMSDEDAAWLHPQLDLDDVLDRYLGLGASLVAITRGGAGCLAATPDDRMAFPSPHVDVVDTIGAGDAFMSGMLFAVLTGDLTGRARQASLTRTDLEAITTTALASARVTVSRAGANPPTTDELASL